MCNTSAVDVVGPTKENGRATDEEIEDYTISLEENRTSHQPAGTEKVPLIRQSFTIGAEKVVGKKEHEGGLSHRVLRSIDVCKKVGVTTFAGKALAILRDNTNGNEVKSPTKKRKLQTHIIYDNDDARNTTIEKHGHFDNEKKKTMTTTTRMNITTTTTIRQK